MFVCLFVFVCFGEVFEEEGEMPSSPSSSSFPGCHSVGETFAYVKHYLAKTTPGEMGVGWEQYRNGRHHNMELIIDMIVNRTVNNIHI